jgi:hypothetical protein
MLYVKEKRCKKIKSRFKILFHTSKKAKNEEELENDLSFYVIAFNYRETVIALRIIGTILIASVFFPLE